MITTIETAKKALIEKGINVNGMYSNIPQLVVKTVNKGKWLGIEKALSQTTLGSKVKSIIVELFNKDTRELKYCEETGKNFLA